MEENDIGAEGEDLQRSITFSRLKPFCVGILELHNKPDKHSSLLPEFLRFLQSSSATALHPFFDFTLFPLLVILDSAVDCRAEKETDFQQNNVARNGHKISHKVSDVVAEYVLDCLEELLKKCYVTSVEQMVLVLSKLTNAALLSPSEAAEEFREGVIKCFRALVFNLPQCSVEGCSCKQTIHLFDYPVRKDLQLQQFGHSKYEAEPGECILSFLQSSHSSAAVGQWLSLLLKTADTEVSRGHRGSGKLRVEAFITLRVLVAKVGTADALAFFLPGVVSQFAKVLHVSKTMISGAAGSVEALNQAIRGLAEYLMTVLQDDSNLHVLKMSKPVVSSSVHSFLEELRQLPMKAEGQCEIEVEGSNEEAAIVSSLVNENRNTKSYEAIGPLCIDRTKAWLEKTCTHVNKLLCATFPQICLHPSQKVRLGLLVAIQGLLLKCSSTLKASRLMLLECLCTLVVDESEEVSTLAQHSLEVLFSFSGKHLIESDFAEIFGRLMEKLPKVVLGSEESLALSNAQRLLVVLYFSGPQFVVNHLQSPVMAARFLDIFGLCLSPNSLFTGALDKLILARPSSAGFLQSVADLRFGSRFSLDGQNIMDVSAPSNILSLTDKSEKEKKWQLDDAQKKYKVPHMPPWFIYIGSKKLYQALAEILRLVGFSLLSDVRSDGLLSTIIDIPLGYLRHLVTEVRLKDSKESWQSWYNRNGRGHSLRQASTAVCILNEIIYGMSDQAASSFAKMFGKSQLKGEEVQESKNLFCESMLKDRKHLIDCTGRILHEYLSPEVWDIPNNHNPRQELSSDAINLHFFHDTAMLHQVLVDGIGIFSLCLGSDFLSSGYLHSSLYLLLENLIHSDFKVRSASDAVLQVLADRSGYPTVGHLVLMNADYVIDSVCRQLRHLELNPHVPNILAAMLSYAGVANKILPLLEEPMRCVSLELEILGRHQHPELTVPFLKVVSETVKASKNESCSFPSKAESFFERVKSKIATTEEQAGKESIQSSKSSSDDANDLCPMQKDVGEWESILFELNDFRRYRRTVASVSGSCLVSATPLLASVDQSACLLALGIVEDGILTLSKLEETYRREKEIKETIEEVFESYSLYELKDAMNAAEVAADANILLPAMNKIWPFLVACVRDNKPVAARRCLGVVSSVIQICGGDFFSRRFHTDGSHFWKLLTTSPFQRKPTKQERSHLQLPYRAAISTSLESSPSEVTNQKVQAAMLNMIADLSRNERSRSAFDVVLTKVSGLVVGIAYSGVVGLRDASISALCGLASIDPDLIWLLLADVYFSLKKNGITSPPPDLDLPEVSQILPPPSSPKEFLYVQYGGQSYGFDLDPSAVESVFRKLHSQVFTNQMYI